MKVVQAATFFFVIGYGTALYGAERLTCLISEICTLNADCQDASEQFEILVTAQDQLVIIIEEVVFDGFTLSNVDPKIISWTSDTIIWNLFQLNDVSFTLYRSERIVEVVPKLEGESETDYFVRSMKAGTGSTEHISSLAKVECDG